LLTVVFVKSSATSPKIPRTTCSMSSATPKVCCSFDL
jgi:hypothetical protein